MSCMDEESRRVVETEMALIDEGTAAVTKEIRARWASLESGEGARGGDDLLRVLTLICDNPTDPWRTDWLVSVIQRARDRVAAAVPPAAVDAAVQRLLVFMAEPDYPQTSAWTALKTDLALVAQALRPGDKEDR
jgi:hypothetical protein